MTARELDLRLKELVKGARRAEAEVAHALLEMKRRGLFRFLGYARLQDYAEAELDMRRGKTKELVELAARLEGLPKVRAAFDAGELPWTKCRLIARVATAEDEERWIVEAQHSTSRGLERSVAEARGERPKVRIMLELTEEEAADIEQAVRVLREERDEAIEIGSAVAELCRRAQGPPVDRPGYQVVIHECPTCGEGSRDADVPVSPEELAAARVDAAVLDLTAGGTGEFHHTITPSERRAVIARDRGRCALCGTRAWLHLHHVRRKDGDVAVLSLLCSTCHKQLIHAGHVSMCGTAPHFDFRLRDGTPAPRAARDCARRAPGAG